MHCTCIFSHSARHSKYLYYNINMRFIVAVMTFSNVLVVGFSMNGRAQTKEISIDVR